MQEENQHILEEMEKTTQGHKGGNKMTKIYLEYGEYEKIRKLLLGLSHEALDSVKALVNSEKYMRRNKMGIHTHG